MIRRPPRSTQSRSSAASDVYKRQGKGWRGKSEQSISEAHKSPFLRGGPHQTGLDVIIGNQRSSATATNLPCCQSLPKPPPYIFGHHTHTTLSHSLSLSLTPHASLARHWRNAAELSTHATRVWRA
eukprot:TRINITY_DN10921_c0_g1_i1.p1 TRINITY_DN10921_c0_g1~~TRINITY_DN10921_c0_g1_i1.p1  ORF type:complete len:126 (-),score=8.13 TRINITY_DN10921_c0_g1_i1:140-517(-)